MCWVKELVLDVFSCEMFFVWEFLCDGVWLFMMVICMIDEWTTSSFRRLYAYFLGCVDDSWRIGILRDILFLLDFESVDREYVVGESENVIVFDVLVDVSVNVF